MPSVWLSSNRILSCKQSFKKRDPNSLKAVESCCCLCFFRPSSSSFHMISWYGSWIRSNIPFSCLGSAKGGGSVTPLTTHRVKAWPGFLTNCVWLFEWWTYRFLRMSGFILWHFCWLFVNWVSWKNGNAKTFFIVHVCICPRCYALFPHVFDWDLTSYHQT